MDSFHHRTPNRREKHPHSYSRHLGNHQTKKILKATKEEDCSLHNPVLTKEKTFEFELKQRSGRQVRCKEMPKQLESRSHSPNIIARLMGLESLPSPMVNAKDEQPESYLHRGLVKLPEKCSIHRPHGMENEKQEFKDVFEDLEISKGKNAETLGPSRVASPKTRKAKSLVTHHKSMNRNHLHSTKSCNSPENLETCTLLIDGDVDDKLNTPLSPRHNPPDFSKFPRLAKFDKEICRVREEKQVHRTKSKSGPGFVRKQGNSEIGSLVRQCSSQTESIHLSSILLGSGSQVEAEPVSVPTRIVVLKPNSTKGQKLDRGVSPSSNVQDDWQIHNQVCSFNNLESYGERKNCRKSDRGQEHSGIGIKGRRVFPNEQNARKSKHVIRRENEKVVTPGRGGYVGDESAYEISEAENTNESDFLKTPPQPFSTWSSWSRSSLPHLTNATLSPKEKKHFSEHWKSTLMFQEVGLDCEGSKTLREMLALSDAELGSTRLSSLMAKHFAASKSSRNEPLNRRDCPLSVRSKDAWKERFPKYLQRSQSIPSVSVYESYKNNVLQGVACSEEQVSAGETIDRDHAESCKRESLVPRSSLKKMKTSYNKSRSSLFWGVEGNEHSQDYIANKNPITASKEIVNRNEVLSVRESHLSQPVAHLISSKETSSTLNQGDAIIEPMPKEHSEKQESPLPSSLGSVLLSNDKEIEQPSPISVLESSFIEEDSVFFQSVSADLHDLRMQLKLLRMESNVTDNDESDISLSSVEETDGPEEPQELNDIPTMYDKSDNHEFSYLLDLLLYSGLINADCDKIVSTLYSQEFPIGPDVFEKLETKYSNYIGWPRSERKLLFDRINSVLVDILGRFMDLYPWANPRVRNVRFGWDSEILAEMVQQLLRDQTKDETLSLSLDFSDLLKKIGLFKVGDEADIVCCGMEQMIMDDLISQLLWDFSRM